MLQESKVSIKRENEVVIVITPYDVVNSLHKTHRDHIKARFEEKGFEVTRWTHTYADDGSHKEEGLIYRTTDSGLDTQMEVVGVIGKSIRAIGPVADVRL